MKILENLLLDYHEVEASKFRWICNNEKQDLEEINLETMEKVSHNISAPKDCIDWYTCICPLPENRTFCYRGYRRRDNRKGIAFIIDENHKIQSLLPSEISTIGYFATFYDNFVYMFGEVFVYRYDLIKRRWKILSNMLCRGYFGDCLSLNGVILFALQYANFFFVFDLWTFSYTWCCNRLNDSIVLCKSEKVIYIIEFCGYILESDKNNFYIWRRIGYFENLYISNCSVKVFYKYSWYFNVKSIIWKFKLSKKKVKRTKASILYDLED